MPAKPIVSHQPHSDELQTADERSGYNSLFQSIKGVAESLQALNRQAMREYAPVVERILRSRSRDTQHIEHTLDGLLDFCGHGPALVLYKKLCRHYWDLDPAAAAWYVHAYRERWDSDANENG
jgi:hypothetical protein